MTFWRFSGELVEHKVDFIVVGGVGAVLQGAPISTFDLDIVHSQDERNLVRLLAPQASHLAASSHQLLITRYGPLDIRGTIGHAHGYENLLPSTVLVDAGPGVNIRVLDLARLIAIKEETADDKDNAVLPILRQVLRERTPRS